MNKNITVVLLLVLLAGCSTQPQEAYPPPMDPSRKVSEQDCTRVFDTGGANLMCTELTEAQRRAMAAEEERQARARREAEERQARAQREAEERAARERAERERAEQLALEEAARKQRAAEEEAARKARAAEEERLAAERRRLEEEAARKAEEERARQLAEQEAREAAARECRRLEQERSEGRALLEKFVATYGKDEEFKGITPQITAFLAKPRKVKPCPPA